MRAARIVFAAIGAAIVVTASAWLAGVRVQHNDSASIPSGWYLRLPIGSVRRGETVAVCPPAAVAALGLARGYLEPGAGCGGVAPLAKVVVAVAGDAVSIGTEGLTIDGELLPRTARRERDPSGRLIPSVRPGRYVVHPGEVWLLGSAASSWDSRYFGPVPAGDVRGRLVLVQTREGAADYEALVRSASTLRAVSQHR